MKRKKHTVGDRGEWLAMRRRNINASDMAALFHSSPYRSMLSLWAEQTGRVPFEETEDNAALRRGRILEPAVAAGLREAHPDWHIEAPGRYGELPDVRIGCTPDFYGWDIAPDATRLGHFLIQAKTVLEDVFLEEWTPAPPAHYLIQVQTEMLVTGIDRVVLAAMVLDNREFPIREYEFRADPEFHEAIIERARQFWRCVASDREPPLNPALDRGTLAAMFPTSRPEPVLALHGKPEFIKLCERYKAIGDQIKTLEAEKETLQCRFAAELREHAKAEAQDYRVSWTSTPEMTVTLHRKAHRRLTVNKLKRKD
jgi:predicted phage-related endonuclease